ncbi:hypothetical protein [Cyanobium sp. NIES-981]|uniref:hypothetical protein n=1 Tax=Cyanobium sp. NIES-981 TaxID=1851505 RepID=UPI0007DD3E09|nr:hypothetical protein [Cyanobium sp. NIES-981]SBO44565.1 protein of unknown function [Cyanobium sp. NIES-981]
MNEQVQAVFAERHGIDLSLMQGHRIPSPTAHRKRNDPYGVHLGAGASAEHFDGRVDALRIHRLERFSNSLAQLCHASHLARRLGVRVLEVPDAWYLRRGSTRLPDGLVVINGTDHFPPEHTRLEGRYFYCHTLSGLAHPMEGFRSLLQQLRPAMHLALDGDPLPDDHLMVHIRCGDIFDRHPHPGYYQPPLAFYSLVLQQRPWSHVHVVFEDFGNPVVLALKRRCEELGLGVSLHSWGLEQDIAFLVRGRHFVAGRGTFMQGVVALSAQAETVYSFWPFDPGNCWGLDGVRNVLIEDRQGRYLNKIRPWRNSRLQRALMLAYPERLLDLRLA